jgi:hypothetical protein
MDPERFKRKTKETKNGVRCKKHPKYVYTTEPRPTKAYPAGCEICWHLWNTNQETKLVVPEVLEDDDNGNGNEDTQFKPGPLHPNWKDKVGEVDSDDPIRDIVRKYTRGGESIVAEISKIAGVHPTHTLNLKQVAVRDRFAALKWLDERGYPRVEEEKDTSTKVYILALGEGTFQEYSRQIQNEMKLIPGG